MMCFKNSLSIFQYFSIDAEERTACDGCRKVLPIEYFPQVKEFIIGYVRGLKNERYPEYM